MDMEGRERDLARQAANGDAVALKLLLTASRHRLYEFISRRVSPDLRRVVDVDDIIQDAHIEVFRRMGDFTPCEGKPNEASSFNRWTSAIALNRLRNAIRRHRALKRGGGRPIVTSAARRFDDSTIALLDTLAGPGSNAQ